MIINPQRAWESPTRPISGPGPKQQPHTWVIHYPGSTSMYEPSTDAEMVAYLRDMQSSYVTRRGYSLGYSVVVSQSGTAWAARGLEGHPGVRVYNPASNPGKKVVGNFNDVSRSIQVAVGGQNPASRAAVETINSIIATQPTWKVIVHSDVDYTSCAGAGITEQVRTGVIGHQQPTKETTMKILNTPQRIADTREYPAVPLTGTHTIELPASIADADAIMVTVTAAAPTTNGFITLWADGPLPTASNLNFAAGVNAIANTTLTRVQDGKFKLHVQGNSHVVLDVVATGN